MSAIVFSYLRVSSLEQADSGLGLDAQEQRIAAYCQQKGFVLTQEFRDAGVSGGKPLADRPAGQALLATLKKAKQPVVVTATLDRLFRSVADAAATINDFEERGVSLVCLAEGFDMTNVFGRAMAQMASVFAELERSMIRERTRKALGIKRKNCERISRWAPYGWRFESTGRFSKKGREIQELVPVEDEQHARQKILRMRARGMKYREIAEELDRSGIKPKHGDKWALCSVEGVVKRKAE